MNDVLREAVLDSHLVTINGVKWHIFGARNCLNDVYLTLSRPTFSEDGDVIAVVMDNCSVNQMVKHGEKLIFYPLNKDAKYIVDTA